MLRKSFVLSLLVLAFAGCSSAQTDPASAETSALSAPLAPFVSPVQVAPNPGTVMQDDTATLSVSIAGVWASTPNTVELSVSGLPAGVTATFGPVVIVPSGLNAALYLAATPTADVTNALVTVTATNVFLTATATFTLDVIACKIPANACATENASCGSLSICGSEVSCGTCGSGDACSVNHCCPVGLVWNGEGCGKKLPPIPCKNGACQ